GHSARSDGRHGPGRTSGGRHMVRTGIAAIGIAALVLLSTRVATGWGTPPQKCAAAKRKAAGKKEAGKLGCYSKAAARTVAVDPTCLTNVETKFTAAFMKAGGACSGSAPAAETAVDACVSALVGAVPGTGRCPAAKLRAAGKAASAELSCWAKAVNKSSI